MDAKDNDNFFERVYTVVRQIPPGRVSTYGAIARYLGSARSSRMVGWAMNSSHTQSEYVPAHRVVNRIGVLTGKNFFGSDSVMRELLENEGMVIENDQLLDFKDRFWDPQQEL
jgi:methylated-DNA-protein-cysteine methyltransferase-like protein